MTSSPKRSRGLQAVHLGHYMPTQEEIYAAFKAYDANSDGRITAKEVADYLTKAGAKKSDRDVLTLMSEFDKDGNGTLDIMEFCDLMSSPKALPYTGDYQAKGVGMAFQFLNDQRNWQMISEEHVIRALGMLCSDRGSEMREVHYSSRGNNYRATQGRDGNISQTNSATNVQRNVRLVPFFFECVLRTRACCAHGLLEPQPPLDIYSMRPGCAIAPSGICSRTIPVPLRRFEEGPRLWKPVSAPEALTALTAVLASSRLKAYRTTNAQGGTFDYEAILLNEQGLIQQCNLSTNKKRRVRCTPIGPDGEAHFEFREGPVGSADWREVSPSCVGQLRAVAAGRGESHYTITYPKGVPHRNISPGTSFRYKASLSPDGFIVQKNLDTGAERPLRPAPWLGLASAVPEERRADPTNGFVPGELEVPPERMQGRRRAEEFYQPEAVSLGSAEAPVALTEEAPPPPSQPSQPSPSSWPVAPTVPVAQPVAQPVVPVAQPVVPQVMPQVVPAQPIFYYQPQADRAAADVSDSSPNAAGLSASKLATLTPKKQSFFKGIKSFLFKDEVGEALKAELKAALDAKCKDEALKKKVSLSELLRDTQMQMDCGVKKQVAMDKALEAAIYIAKNTK